MSGQAAITEQVTAAFKEATAHSPRLCCEPDDYSGCPTYGQHWCEVLGCDANDFYPENQALWDQPCPAPLLEP